jgi:hypothetical protein
MHTTISLQNGFPDTILDYLNIDLLKKFKMYNSKGNNLFCSYMSVGQKYENELLIIGREPLYWPEDFSIEELNKRGEENIFRTKVYHHAIFGNDSPCPLKYVTDLWGDTELRKKYNTSYNSMLDPFWSCIKDVVLKLGICKDETNWPSSIALTYLYKIAFSTCSYLREKPRMIQFEHCKEMFLLELSILKPKRILFLTGMKNAQDFLEFPNSLNLEELVWNLGEIEYGSHKARTVVSVNPKRYHRDKLVNLILAGFKHKPSKNDILWNKHNIYNSFEK